MAVVAHSSDLGLFHHDEALTGYAQGYAQDLTSFIADQIAPPIPVDNKSDTYYVGKTERLQRHDVRRAPGGLFAQIEWEVSEDAYICKPYGCEVTAPWEWNKNADAAIDFEQQNSVLAVDVLMHDYEARVAAAASSTDNFAHADASEEWDETATGTSAGDPYDDVEAAKATVIAATGHVPNLIWMNYPTYRALTNNTNMKERVKYTEMGSAAVITPNLLCHVFDVEKLLVAKGVYDASVPGSGVDPAMTWIWPTGTVGVAYVDNRIATLRAAILSPMRTFVWTAMGGRFSTRSYVFDPRNANVTQCADYVDEKVTCAGAQALITSCIGSD